MTWKNRKRLAMVRIQLRKTLKYLLHVGFTKDQTPVFLCLVFFIGLISFGVCQICEALMVLSECLSCSGAPIDSAGHLKFFCSCVSDGDFMVFRACF